MNQEQAFSEQGRNSAKPAGGWTIDEYATLRRVHPVTVKRWIQRGSVEVVRDSKRSVRILGPQRTK